MLLLLAVVNQGLLNAIRELRTTTQMNDKGIPRAVKAFSGFYRRMIGLLFKLRDEEKNRRELKQRDNSIFFVVEEGGNE